MVLTSLKNIFWTLFCTDISDIKQALYYRLLRKKALDLIQTFYVIINGAEQEFKVSVEFDPKTPLSLTKPGYLKLVVIAALKQPLKNKDYKRIGLNSNSLNVAVKEVLSYAKICF